MKAREVLVLVAGIVIAVGAIQLVAGAVRVGVTIDEPVQNDRMQSWLDNGWYVPEQMLVEGRPDPTDDLAKPYTYGPAFSILAHGANVAVGNESRHDVSRSRGAYAIRHLVVALTALLAIAAVAAAVWCLCGSAPIALWSAAGLIALPQWTGQAFFNVKDVPAAAGYTLVTAALVFALADPGPRSSRWRRVGVGSTLAAGIWLAAGTRSSLWAAVFASLVLYTVLRLGQSWIGKVSGKRSADLTVAAGALLGALAVAASYPNVTRHPRTFLVESIAGSTEYSYEGFTLTGGQLLSEHPPWWYLPAWAGATLPLLLGALALAGIVLAVVFAVRSARTWSSPATWVQPWLALPLVVVQALLLPVLTVLDGAVIYSGFRQHIYVLPAAAILAGVSAAWCWRWAGAVAWRRRLVVAGLSLALLAPMVSQSLLFPYNYTYLNPAVSLSGVNDRWETDYWFASEPEAISKVPAGAEVLCSANLVPGWSPDSDPEIRACEDDQFEDFTALQGSAVGELASETTGDYTWIVARKRGGNRPPDYCEEVDKVTRPMLGEEVVMAYVLRCDRERSEAALAGN